MRRINFLTTKSWQYAGNKTIVGDCVNSVLLMYFYENQNKFASGFSLLDTITNYSNLDFYLIVSFLCQFVTS